MLACILGLLSGYVFVSKLESALEEVQASQAPLKARMAQIREAQARAEAVRSEANVIEKLKTNSISPVAVLEELTRLLPDSAYLIDLKISGDTIDIAGLAKNSAALIPVIERSSFFYGAASTAPLTLEPSQEKEHFSIRMRVRSAKNKAEKQIEDGQ